MSVYKQPLRSNELYHHGVMGMKWGEHRFQNANGSLTDKGKKRFAKVASSERLTKRENKRAIGIYKYNRRGLDKYSNRQAKASEKLNVKASKATEQGNKAKAEKLQQKAKVKAQTAKKYMDTYNMYSKEISKIESGKRKAGRDFITQKDHYFYAVPTLVGVLISTTTRTQIINKH